MTIDELIDSVNIAELLDESELADIGNRAVRGYELDDESRSDWAEQNERAMSIAKQTIERKTHPFPGASNIKYPLITRASIDFAARTYPEVIQGTKVVRPGVIGNDEDGSKAERASRVSKHMSIQLLDENMEWEEGTDKLLHILPIIGTVFRKTYYSPILKRNVSEVCHPDDIVVNYNISSLEAARRVTHIIPMYTNDVVERVRAELYRDVDVELLKSSEGYGDGDVDPALNILEQHCFLDLDDDGYQEPYVVTIHKETQEVLRIVARYEKSSIEFASNGKIQRITPDNYFTDYHFIKSPDGGYYSLGLGQLLYPINEAINTTLNQLVDSGTLSNSQAGFIGRGLRIKGGQLKVRLGEWKILDAATGTDIKNNIVPLPVKEPSNVLLQLLGLLIESGKDLATVQDTMQGKGPTQNVPATTVLTMVEQGLKVFNAVQKRLYRSFKSEFKKLFKLNRKHLTNAEYRRIMDIPNIRVSDDYNTKDMDICPIADPSASSDTQRIARAKVLMDIPGLNPYVQRKMLLEALQIPESQIEALLPPPDPNAPPPPEMQKIMAEVGSLQAKTQADSAGVQIKVADLQLKKQQLEMQLREAMARIEKMEADAIVNFEKVDNVNDKIEFEQRMDTIKTSLKAKEDNIAAAIKVKELDLKSKEIEAKTKDKPKDTD
jgi:chaperonin GroES